MRENYVFEVIEQDSGCSSNMAEMAAQELVNDGVVAVAGAACSNASMGANIVLSKAGIPQISYASTSPALSDATAYPDFFRIVPSDAQQGNAMADMVAASGRKYPVLIYIRNDDYGEPLKNSIISQREKCKCLSYYIFSFNDEISSTDFFNLVKIVKEEKCDSVVLPVSLEHGKMIIKGLVKNELTLPIFGSDQLIGILDNNTDMKFAAFLDGLKVTTLSDANVLSIEASFTEEAYDAVMMIGKAAMIEDGANMKDNIMKIGKNYKGKRGVHTFLENGDVIGPGYNIGTFYHIPLFGDYYNETQRWDNKNKITNVQFTGDTYKIGFLTIGAGHYLSKDGVQYRAAAKIAIEMLNKIGWNMGIQFEVIEADSKCNSVTAASAAQSLIDAGVVGVVGAACSGASIGANAVLSAEGIPMILYASASLALSDAKAYPDFFRVETSDALQGQALGAVVQNDIQTSSQNHLVGLLYMNNHYGRNIAKSFAESFKDNISDNISDKTIVYQVGYDADDFTSNIYKNIVTELKKNQCTIAVLASYEQDGKAIIKEMIIQKWSGHVYSGDTITNDIGYLNLDNSSISGITKIIPKAIENNVFREFFNRIWCELPNCDENYQNNQAFDAMFIIGISIYFQVEYPTISLSELIMIVGQKFNGASGIISFMDNGDVAGAGYSVGVYTEDTDQKVSFTITNRSWDPINGIYFLFN